jgi:hypothetical protein
MNELMIWLEAETKRLAEIEYRWWRFVLGSCSDSANVRPEAE